MKIIAAITFTLILTLISLPVQASSTLATAGTSGQACRDFSVATVATTITAGDIVYCLNSDGPTPTSTSSSKFQMSAIIMTPQLGANPAVTFTVTVKSSSCTFGTAATAGTLLTGAFGTESSSTWEVTMTSNLCHGYIEGKVVSNTVTVFDDLFAFNVEAADFTTYVDNLNRLCNGSTFTSDCDRPYLNIGQWPRLQTESQSDEAGEIQFTANGPLIQLPDSGSVTIPLLIEALAPPSVVGATAISIAPLVDAVRGGNAVCTVSSSILTANSGTLTDGSKKFQYSRNVVIDADYCHVSGTATLSTAGAPAGQVIFNWIFTRNVERLTGTVNNALSGTVNNALSGTVNNVLSGTVNNVLSGTVAISQSGTWTITDDANGWAVNLNSLTGTFTVNGMPDDGPELTSIANAISSLQKLWVKLCGNDSNFTGGTCTIPQINSNSTVQIDGNVNVTSNETHNQINPPPEIKPLTGFLFFLTIGLVLAFLGERSRDNYWRMFGGIFIWISAIAILMDWQKLKLDLRLVLISQVILWGIAIYLLIPKDKKETAPNV